MMAILDNHLCDPSVLGLPWTSKLVLNMVCEHHQSQVQDVPSVPGLP